MLRIFSAVSSTVVTEGVSMMYPISQTSHPVRTGRGANGDLARYPAGLLQTSGDVDGGQQGLEAVGAHAFADAMNAGRIEMPASDPQHIVYAETVGQHILGYPVVGHPILLYGSHRTFCKRIVAIGLFACYELQNRISEELQPLVGIDGFPVAGTVMSQRPAEQGHFLRRDRPVTERRTGEQLADGHLETRLHIESTLDAHTVITTIPHTRAQILLMRG